MSFNIFSLDSTVDMSAIFKFAYVDKVLDTLVNIVINATPTVPIANLFIPPETFSNSSGVNLDLLF